MTLHDQTSQGMVSLRKAADVLNRPVSNLMRKLKYDGAAYSIELGDVSSKKTILMVSNRCNFNCRDPDCLAVSAHGVTVLQLFFSGREPDAFEGESL